jgi:hypothetical protein
MGFFCIKVKRPWQGQNEKHQPEYDPTCYVQVICVPMGSKPAYENAFVLKMISPLKTRRNCF